MVDPSSFLSEDPKVVLVCAVASLMTMVAQEQAEARAVSSSISNVTSNNLVIGDMLLGGVDSAQQQHEDENGGAYGYYIQQHQPGQPPRVRSSVNLEALHQQQEQLRKNKTTSLTTSNQLKTMRVVAIRYFLDRPGYGLHNSAARLWFDAPAICTPTDVYTFLKEQQIAMDGLLIEVYIDKIQSFMLLEACEACMVEWDFTDVTALEPGILNIRLTDLAHARSEEQLMEHPGVVPAGPAAAAATPKRALSGSGGGGGIQLANVTPSGLFSFSMMVGLEMAALTAKLIPGSIDESYLLRWGPYMFFVGGLMQILVAIFQVVRNNVYGATAFFGFGCFWFSNGLIEILSAHFSGSGTLAEDLVGEADDWGNFVRIMFILAFCIGLEIQTFAMNKLSSTLIGLLCLKVFFQAISPWSKACQWLQFGFGWATSFFAFYVFLTEFTNQVYHKEVFPVFRWSEENSPEEVFGAAGRSGTLTSKATRLRQAAYPNIRTLREASVATLKVKKES